MTYLTMLTLRLPPDRTESVVEYYRGHRVLEAAGTVAAQLLVSIDDPGTVLVVATWSDPAAYVDWQGSPRRAEFGAGLSTIVDGQVETSSREFRVVHQIS